MAASAYRYYRDCYDGTIQRERKDGTGGGEVQWPSGRWAPWAIKHFEVVEIREIPERPPRPEGGEAARPYPRNADGRIRVEVRVPFPPGPQMSLLEAHPEEVAALREAGFSIESEADLIAAFAAHWTVSPQMARLTLYGGDDTRPVRHALSPGLSPPSP